MLSEARAALGRFEGAGRHVLASFDVDCVGAAWASGVSALTHWGISSGTAIQLARTFSRCPVVAVFDLIEYAPACDKDGRTGWLLASEYVLGLGERAQPSR